VFVIQSEEFGQQQCKANTLYLINQSIMSTFRSRSRIFGCILPRTSSRKHVIDDKDTDSSSRNLLVEEEDDCKSYNLETHREGDQGGDERTSCPAASDDNRPPFLPTLSEEEPSQCEEDENDIVFTPMGNKYGAALSPIPAAMTASDSSSAATISFADLTQSYGDLELDHEQDRSIISASSITGCSMRSTPTPMSMSAPNSPHPSPFGSSSSMNWHTNSPVLSYCSGAGAHSYSLPASPVSKPRRPLTTPVRPKSPSRQHRRSLSQSSTGTCSSTSSLLLPLTLSALPEPCPQVKSTLTLLKSIKHQIKAMKRREARLSTQLHVQRRERQQMQEQIAHLEARRLRVEAMFVRPLPLVLLLPVIGQDEEYDLCLISEGSDAWNAMPPLIRIELIQQSPSKTSGRNISSRGRGAALLIHFGPTLTQPMAAALSFVQNSSMDSLQPGSGTIADLVDLDLQPLVKSCDPSFWERVTCGRVLEADKSNQLEDVSCQFLFDALLRDLQELWRGQLTQVVDKNTRRIQWILPQEADALYYDAIPSASPVPLPLDALPPLPHSSATTSLTSYLTSEELVLL
jgi:hypothetical protein